MTSAKGHRVAIVDDESVAINVYRRALELGGHEVLHYTSVDDFLFALSPRLCREVEMFIVDVMMPPGESLSSCQTNHGLYTGLFVAQAIRERSHRVRPIVLLSNLTFYSVRHAARRMSRRLSNCIVLEKSATLPHELLEIVDRYFTELRLQPRRSGSIFKRLFGSILLQPNISGIGIDLRKLGEDDSL